MQQRRRLLALLVTAVVGCIGDGGDPGEHHLPLRGQNLARLDPGVPFEGRYIVVLRDAAQDGPEDVARGAGVQTEHVYRHALRGFSAVLPEQALQGLRHNPNIEIIQPDSEVTIDQALDDRMPTGVARMGGATSAATELAAVLATVNVAVIDTGIDLDHPDLNVAGGVHLSKGQNRGGDDNNSHGTHVAGTIGAEDDGAGVVGVAPGVRLWAVKVLDSQGSGSTASVVAGIDWVTGTRSDANASNDIAVANMSLGGAGADNIDGVPCGTRDANGNWTYATNDAEHRAICRSVAAGVVYVVAAGNSAIDAQSQAPASFDEVITVSALADFNGLPGGGAASTCREDEDDSFAVFSNYGHDVDIMAPGVCIESTIPNGAYGTKSGTSMASPHVAGAAALWVAANNMAADGATVAAVRAALVAAGQTGPCATPSGLCEDDPDAFDEPFATVAMVSCAADGDCNDGSACTADSCDPAIGCLNAPTGCTADADLCTAELCDAALGCGSSAVSCDDVSLCTADSCDPRSGCANDPVTCADDGNACTLETCDPALGCLPPAAISCNDGQICTADSCDAATGCVNAAIVACTGGDGCCAPACVYATDNDCCRPARTQCTSNGQCCSGLKCRSGSCR
jgi:hypothetical protein